MKKKENCFSQPTSDYPVIPWHFVLILLNIVAYLGESKIRWHIWGEMQNTVAFEGMNSPILSWSKNPPLI